MNARLSLRSSRRTFLTVAGSTAIASRLGFWDYAERLSAAVPPAVRRPRVRAVFVRPNTDRNWMGWPGAHYDPEFQQNQYTRILTEAAGRLGMELEITALPLHEPERVSEFLEGLVQSPPDGLVITAMNLKSWQQVHYLALNRPDIPTIVFSPLGTAFGEQIQPIQRVPHTFVAATQDAHWLAAGMRMLKTTAEMKSARLCIVGGNTSRDAPVQALGTTLHYVPLDRWPAEVRKVEESDQVRALADYYTREAVRIVEPRQAEILAAAKNYFVARNIMAAERCQGISVDCYRLLNERQIGCGMCLAWSRLLDEGIVAACEADSEAAVTMSLVIRLFDRPGFMQDPAPNTVSNTLVGSHCTCATKLAGFNQPHEPFELRNHAETETGVSLKVAWRPEQEITIVKFRAPDALAMTTGRVVGNIAEQDATGCRTAIEVRLDGVAPETVRGHHQLFVYGKLDAPLSAFAALAGLHVTRV